MMIYRQGPLMLLSSLLAAASGGCGDSRATPESDNRAIERELTDAATALCDAYIRCFGETEVFEEFGDRSGCIAEFRQDLMWETTYDRMSRACAAGWSRYYRCMSDRHCSDIVAWSSAICQDEYDGAALACFRDESGDPDDAWTPPEPWTPEDPADVHPGYASIREASNRRCVSLAECYPETIDTLFVDHDDCVARWTELTLEDLVDYRAGDRDEVSVACGDAELAFATCVVGLSCDEQEYWWDTPCEDLAFATDEHCAVRFGPGH